MEFTKYTGLGNDFIFLDGQAALSVKDPSVLAKRLCDRRFGIGADGLVLLLPSQQADVQMRIINSDGSEAEMCGNASRCVPLHLLSCGTTDKKQITLETLAGKIQTEVIDIAKGLVRVNMGVPRLMRGEIPMQGNAQELVINVPLEIEGNVWHGTAVSMGNPHFVIFAQDVEAINLKKWGPQLETHPVFPRKTNVEFVQILDEEHVRMRVWERGAGITQACGTGACATAVACVLNHKTQPAITVHLDGGDLKVEWPQHKDVWMTGPAKKVFTGNIDL